jgi:thiosulfate reductase cytochrome b subunit
MIVYATHNILTEADCPLGYLLLRCVRLYLELDMYASLEVHTTETISSGRHTHLAFAALLRVCLIYYLLLSIGN